MNRCSPFVGERVQPAKSCLRSFRNPDRRARVSRSQMPETARVLISTHSIHEHAMVSKRIFMTDGWLQGTSVPIGVNGSGG
jgi:hypothetical protein